jgi:hypothetical protein
MPITHNSRTVESMILGTGEGFLFIVEESVAGYAPKPPKSSSYNPTVHHFLPSAGGKLT